MAWKLEPQNSDGFFKSDVCSITIADNYELIIVINTCLQVTPKLARPFRTSCPNFEQQISLY